MNHIFEEHPNYVKEMRKAVNTHHLPLYFGKNGIMAADEKLVVARFRKEIVVTSEDGSPLSLADRALPTAKNKKEINYEYQPMEWLNPTSNVVEWLFSRAKKVLSDHRMSMLPLNLEETPFLNINKRFWDIDVISKIVEQ